MQLELIRYKLAKDYTIGSLSIDGEVICDTLEHAVRYIATDGTGKIKGKTAIPYGEYKVVVNRSPRFKRDLPLLLDVPLFEGVRIHAGNSTDDTAGCILVGEYKGQGNWINNSRKYEEQITQRIIRATKYQHEQVTILITTTDE